MWRILKNFDWLIVLPVLVLIGFSLVVIASIFPELFWPQLGFFVIGLCLMGLFSLLDNEIYSIFSVAIFIFSIIALGITYLIGWESRGAIRWIPIFGFGLQFSEILKPFILAANASFIVRWGYKGAFLSLIPIFLVLRQPDLGSAIVYLAGVLGAVFIGGLPFIYIVIASVIAAVMMPVGYLFLKDYQRARITSFLNPTADPLGSSYNAIQAVIAVGSGMIMGKGLGHGTQSQLAFLPERHTDFIFASFAEEFGLIGVAIICLCYGLIIFRIIKIASKTSDQFTIMLLGGVAVMFGIQIFINIGMNMGIVPITGITLPLLSYGGSSILSTMIILGIVQSAPRRV